MIEHISKWPTGSRYICNPPPTDTDNDTVVLVKSLHESAGELTRDGWTIDGNYGPDEEWISLKKEIDGVKENYIMMQNLERYGKWVTATELAKKLNLLEKTDRIAVFDVIVGGNTLY